MTQNKDSINFLFFWPAWSFTMTQNKGSINFLSAYLTSSNQPGCWLWLINCFLSAQNWIERTAPLSVLASHRQPTGGKTSRRITLNVLHVRFDCNNTATGTPCSPFRQTMHFRLERLFGTLSAGCDHLAFDSGWIGAVCFTYRIPSTGLNPRVRQ